MTYRKHPYGPGRQEYVSEFAQFMDGYLREHPEVRRDQMAGWRIWWERPQAQALKELELAMHDNQPPTVYHSYYYE